MSSAKPEDRAAVKATIDIFKTVNRVESPMQNKPDLSQVSGVGERAVIVEEVIKGQDATIFGRTVETGQMPQDWIAARGVTKDVDYFTPSPSKAGKEVYQKYPEDYVPKSGDDFTAIMSKETGRTAFDIHPYPEGYPVGKTSTESPTGDYVQAQINPLPTKSGILNTEGIPQEKLYVQARRKATSVLGEEPGTFGPPEHRMKDVQDLMNYASFLSKQTSGSRKATLEKSFLTLQDYYTKPDVYSKYLEGDKYSSQIKGMKFGKATNPTTDIPKGFGREDVRFTSVPSEYPERVSPSILGMSGVSRIARSDSPSPISSIDSLVSSAVSSNVGSKSGVSNKPTSPSPYMNRYSPTTSPSIWSIIPVSPTSTPPTSPTYSKTPSTPPYTPPYSPPTSTPPTSTPPYVPPYSPPYSPPYNPPSKPPTSVPPFEPVLLPNFGGSGGYGTKRRPRKFSELFPVGLFDSTMAGMRGKRLPKTKAKKGRLIPKKWGK